MHRLSTCALWVQRSAWHVWLVHAHHDDDRRWHCLSLFQFTARPDADDLHVANQAMHAAYFDVYACVLC